jgi:hypothetical protein
MQASATAQHDFWKAYAESDSLRWRGSTGMRQGIRVIATKREARPPFGLSALRNTLRAARQPTAMRASQIPIKKGKR